MFNLICILFASFFILTQADHLGGIDDYGYPEGFRENYHKYDGQGGVKFAYGVVNPKEGSANFHQEKTDSWGNKYGSYGLKDRYGNVKIVNYVADKNGYRVGINGPVAVDKHIGFIKPWPVPKFEQFKPWSGEKVGYYPGVKGLPWAEKKVHILPFEVNKKFTPLPQVKVPEIRPVTKFESCGEFKVEYGKKPEYAGKKKLEPLPEMKPYQGEEKVYEKMVDKMVKEEKKFEPSVDPRKPEKREEEYPTDVDIPARDAARFTKGYDHY